MREAKFAPTLAEVLAACRDAQAQLASTVQVYHRALEAHNKLTGAIDALDARGPITPEQEQAFLDARAEEDRRRIEAIEGARRQQLRAQGLSGEVPF